MQNIYNAYEAALRFCSKLLLMYPDSQPLYIT